MLRSCEYRAEEGSFFLSLFSFREARAPVILSAAGAKDLLFVSAAPQQVLRSRACRALAQDDSAARPVGERKRDGDHFHSLLRGASERVILSAADAKDLLCPRESYTVTLVTPSGTRRKRDDWERYPEP